MPATTPIDVLRTPCPHRAVRVSLPLATIEQLDSLATAGRVPRSELLRQIVTAALTRDAPHLPVGPDSIGQLADRAHETHRRSIEIANGNSH